MKIKIAALLLVIISAFAFQQHEIVGIWKYNDPDGNALMIEFKEDNTYQVDFGNDGSYDLMGSYAIEGDKLTITDAVGDCQGKPGVYTMAFASSKLTLSQISEECQARKVEEGSKLEFDRQ